jgi:hypothetical protein
MADSKDLKDFGKELGVANDKLESFASSIKKLIREEVDGFKKVNNQLSIGKDLVEELASSYNDIKDIIGDIDLSRTISQENDLLNKLSEKKNLENKIASVLNDYIKNKKEYGELEEKLSSVAEEHADYYGESIYRLADMQKELKQNLKTLLSSYDTLLKQNRALEEQKRSLEDIRITIENTFGFGQFKGLFGILAKLPNLENAFKNMSLSTMMFLGLATMYLKAVFGTLYKAFDDVNGAFVKTAKSFGLLKDESETLKSFIYDTTINLSKYGIVAEEVAATVTNMVDAFGSFTLFNAKAAEDITLISKQLGVGNKELVDGVMTLMSFGKIDMVKATKVVYFADALSKAAGVPLAKVMEDVAKAGDKARGMIKGGAEQLVKAAVYARRLGTDLEKVAEIGRKMLDFQESITDEIEASVLLGSNISFQKARELFYTGKIQEGYDEIFKVVKNIGDFNKLDIFQKEAIAKSTGLSLTDLQKQLQIREDLAALEISGSDEAKKMVQEYKKLNEQSGAVLENTAAAREQRVRDVINLKETEEITARIKSLFYSIANDVLPIIEGILSFINGTLKVFDGTLGKIIIGLGTIIAGGYAIVNGYKLAKFVLVDLKNIFTMIRGASVAVTAQMGAQAVATNAAAASQTALNVASSASVGTGGFMSFLMSINPKQLLSISAVMISFAGALYILAKAGQEFNSVDWESMGKLGTAAVGLTALTLAIVGLSTIIDASFEVILPAAAIIGVLSLAMLGLGKAAQLVGEGTKNFGEGLKIAVGALIDFGQNVSILRSVKLAGVFSVINSSIRDFDLSRLQSIVSAMQSLALSLNSISAFKGIPQLTLPTNAVNTTNVPTVLANTSVISPTQTNVQTTNAPVNNSTSIIDAVSRGIKEGMNNISLNVYLDGQKMVTGLSKNVGFRQDTGGIAMQSSLT